MDNGHHGDPIVLTKGLTKRFNGETAVENLDLTIPPGVIFGFIGPSGCGKTTSVRLMLGVYRPDEGEVEVMGRSPEEFGRQERARIGYMPQQFVLYPELSVWENMNFAASLYGYPLQRKQRLQEMLELVELTGHEKKRVRNLSGGMKRRLSLAVSILHQPDLVFLDEPTAGIDPVLRQKFWDYFKTLKNEGHTLFITTQYVGEAAYCDYVGVMADGRLLMVDTPRGLRLRAQGGDIIHLHTHQFLPESHLTKLKDEPYVIDKKVVRIPGNGVELVVDDASESLPTLIEWCQTQDLSVKSVSEHVPLFDDIFVELINQSTRGEETNVG